MALSLLPFNGVAKEDGDEKKPPGLPGGAPRGTEPLVLQPQSGALSYSDDDHKKKWLNSDTHLESQPPDYNSNDIRNIIHKN